MKTQNTDNVLGVIEHDNGRTYQIKYLQDNEPNARFVVVDQKSGQKLGGFENYDKASHAAKLRDKTITDQVYETDSLLIKRASREEIDTALARIFPRSELTRQLQELPVREGIKVKGKLQKIRTAVYSFAQSSKRKFTVRPTQNKEEWLVIRIN